MGITSAFSALAKGISETFGKVGEELGPGGKIAMAVALPVLALPLGVAAAEHKLSKKDAAPADPQVEAFKQQYMQAGYSEDAATKAAQQQVKVQGGEQPPLLSAEQIAAIQAANQEQPAEGSEGGDVSEGAVDTTQVSASADDGSGDTIPAEDPQAVAAHYNQLAMQQAKAEAGDQSPSSLLYGQQRIIAG